jgi:hypothetical protein
VAPGGHPASLVADHIGGYARPQAHRGLITERDRIWRAGEPPIADSAREMRSLLGQIRQVQIAQFGASDRSTKDRRARNVASLQRARHDWDS